jgi:hypothetical protein
VKSRYRACTSQFKKEKEKTTLFAFEVEVVKKEENENGLT